MAPAATSGSSPRPRSSSICFADGWSADGKQLLFSEVTPSIQCAIGQISDRSPVRREAAREKRFCNVFAAVSPRRTLDGLHLERPGRIEIYVERYPELGNRQPISTGGGVVPLWSRDGRELFFSSLDGRQMFAVAGAVRDDTRRRASAGVVRIRHALRLAVGIGAYDVAPDGRFLIIQQWPAEAGGATAPNLIFVQNWFEELKRLVPAN